jgi:hypothetical protein
VVVADPQIGALVVGSIHYRKHRGGTASLNTMAMDI